MSLNLSKPLFLLICFISLSCDHEYSRYKIKGEPVFDEKYYKASLQAIEESIKKNPEHSDGYFKKAVLLTKMNQVNDAETAIEKAIGLEKNPEYFMLATQVYLEKNDLDKGLEAALAAENGGMNNGWLFSIIAKILLQQGENQLAFEYMEKAITFDPTNPSNHINKGNLLLNARDTAKAIESFQTALKNDSTNYDALTSLTEIFLAQHQYKQAEQALNQKHRHHEKDKKSITQSAYLLWKSGDLAGARNSFDKIKEDEPTDYQAYLYISLIEFQKKQYDSASWYAEKALSLKNDTKEAMLTLARIKDINRQYYTALVQYDKILKLDTAHRIAKTERARIQWKINNLARQRQQENAPIIAPIQQRF